MDEALIIAEFQKGKIYAALTLHLKRMFLSFKPITSITGLEKDQMHTTLYLHQGSLFTF